MNLLFKYNFMQIYELGNLITLSKNFLSTKLLLCFPPPPIIEISKSFPNKYQCSSEQSISHSFFNFPKTQFLVKNYASKRMIFEHVLHLKKSHKILDIVQSSLTPPSQGGMDTKSFDAQNWFGPPRSPKRSLDILTTKV